MTCLIPRPSPQVLFDTYKNMLSSTVLGGSDVIPESNEWYVTALNYAMAESFYAISEQQWKERDPRYACCDNLKSLAALDGMYPKTASFAEGYGLITGTVGAALIANMQISVNEQTYQSVGSVPAVIPSSGSVTVRFRALQAGMAGNSDPANLQTTATLTTPLLNVNSSVSVYSGTFCGGAEAEECEAFRTRYLARKRFAPRATAAWIKEKLLEWPCATRVCDRSGSCCTAVADDCYGGCADCNKKLEYYVLFDNTFTCGLPPQCVADDITTWMFGERQGYGEGQAEVGICGKIYTAEAAPVVVSISGAACYSVSQKNEMLEQIADLFTTFCPSQPLNSRQVELVVAQILGYVPELDITLSTTSTKVTTTPCGDLEPDCDVMLCLSQILFPDDATSKVGCF